MTIAITNCLAAPLTYGQRARHAWPTCLSLAVASPARRRLGSIAPPCERGIASRPVSRVLSGGEPSATAIPLGRGSLRASSNQPGRRRGSRWVESCLPPRAAPIRSCSRWGLPCRLRCRTRGALLPHRFTLAVPGCPAQAVSSLWHFPWGRPRRPLAATVDPWSPDFPPPRPMAAKPPHAAAAVRPTGKRNKGAKGRRVKRRQAGRIRSCRPFSRRRADRKGLFQSS